MVHHRRHHDISREGPREEGKEDNPSDDEEEERMYGIRRDARRTNWLYRPDYLTVVDWMNMDNYLTAAFSLMLYSEVLLFFTLVMLFVAFRL